MSGVTWTLKFGIENLVVSDRILDIQCVPSDVGMYD